MKIQIIFYFQCFQNVELDKHISHNGTHVTQVNSEEDLVDKHISFYRYYLHTSPMRLNSLYVQVYAVYMNFIFNGVGPFSLLIVLNILIVKDLQTQKTLVLPLVELQVNENMYIIIQSFKKSWR